MSDTQPSTKITKQQWKGLIAAWLGWAFDGLDGYLYVIVAGRFVRQLLEQERGIAPTGAEIASKAAIIQGFFLIGWALGGAIFGGDKERAIRVAAFGPGDRRVS